MRSSSDSTPVCSPDSLGPSGGSLDSLGPIPIGLGAAVDLFCAATAAEGSSPRTLEWYRMILIRAGRRSGAARPVDAIPAGLAPRAADLARARVDRRLCPGSEGVRQLVRRRGTRRGGRLPGAPPPEGAAPAHRPVLRSGAAEPARPGRRAGAGARARAARHRTPIVRARLLRVGDVRPDGTLHVMGKGAKERIVPIGSTARRALVRYLATRAAVAAGDPLFCGRWGPGWPGAARRRKRPRDTSAPTGHAVFTTCCSRGLERAARSDGASVSGLIPAMIGNERRGSKRSR